MVTISHIVKKTIAGQPIVREALGRGIINYAALAESMKPQIEKELGSEAKETAIIMALRRHAEELQVMKDKGLKAYFGSDITLKNNIVDISIAKTQELYKDMEKLYRAIGYEKGILNIVQGNEEISLITNEKSFRKVEQAVDKRKIIQVTHKLAAISMSISKDYLYTPGILAELTRHLAWNGINIFEVISTNTEITFIISEKDGTRAYNVLTEMIV